MNDEWKIMIIFRISKNVKTPFWAALRVKKLKSTTSGQRFLLLKSNTMRKRKKSKNFKRKKKPQQSNFTLCSAKIINLSSIWQKSTRKKSSGKRPIWTRGQKILRRRVQTTMILIGQMKTRTRSPSMTPSVRQAVTNHSSKKRSS